MSQTNVFNKAMSQEILLSSSHYKNDYATLIYKYYADLDRNNMPGLTDLGV